jgi:hypothetical protein
MIGLVKYMAMLGLAGTLSLAPTGSFAQNVGGAVCGTAANGVHYC